MNFQILSLAVALFLVSANIAFDKVIYPAYVSTVLDCNLSPSLESQTTSSGTFDVKTQEITISSKLTEAEQEKTIKHEMTHYVQYEEERLHECNESQINGFPMGIFFNEVEATVAEYLPEPKSRTISSKGITLKS